MFGWLTGKIWFRAIGANTEQFLSVCIQKNLPIAEVTPIELGFEGWIPTRNYTTFCQIAEKNQCEIVVLQHKKGMARKSLFANRMGMIIGIFLMLFLIALSGNMIWAVRFDGFNILEQQQIRSQLYQNGICEGAWINREKLQQAHQLLMEQGEFGWLTLNFYRGRLVVEGSTEIQKPQIEGSAVSDLVSSADGMIVQINVTKGDILCFPGQQVVEGQLLVSGNYQDREGNVLQTRSKGEVYVRTNVTYYAEQPLEQSAIVAQRILHTNYFVNLLGQRFPLGKVYKATQNDVSKVSYSPFTILGFALPATLEKQQIVQTKQEQSTLTQQQAIELAKLNCRQQLEQEFPQAIIETEAVQWQLENGILKLKMEFNGLVQAAKEIPKTE